MPSIISSGVDTRYKTRAEYSSSGSWTVPANTYMVKARLLGGGAYCATGKGDSGKFREIELAVTPGASMPYVVGAAGFSGAPNGGMSTFAGCGAEGGTGQFDPGESGSIGGIGYGGAGRGSFSNGTIAATAGRVEICY
jgi:hypothetical protein